MNAWQLAVSNLATIPHDDRRVCKQCGARFVPNQQSRSVYCSTVCKELGATENKRRAARRAKEQKKLAKNAALPTAYCKHCGIEFVKKSKTQTYCSRSCAAKASPTALAALFSFKRKEEYVTT